MSDYDDLFSQHEPDPLLRELNGNILWYWKPMNPHDRRPGCISNSPFEAVKRIEHLERELAEERRSREEAQAFAWKFSDALHEITKTPPFGKPQEIAREALGEK
jgi:hypothetical protein